MLTAGATDPHHPSGWKRLTAGRSEEAFRAIRIFVRRASKSLTELFINSATL